MPDVMSQSEIDALLNALDTGDISVEEMQEEDTRKIKDYDFRNPQKMSKEQLKTLEVIHENFGRSLQTFLTGLLRVSVKTKILTVDQFAYSEFSNAISNPAFLLVIDFLPLPGQILIDISPSIMYIIIDRLLGGFGSDKQEIRAFTQIELSLLKRTMSGMTTDLKTAWGNVVELEPELNKIEVNPQFAQIVAPNETIALVTMSLEIGNMQGMLNVCLPYITIEQVVDRLTTRSWFNASVQEGERDDLDKVALHNRILNTVVPVIACLGGTTITINDIANLRIGDVIKLDRMTKDDIEVSVGTKMKYKASIGTKDRKMAVCISEVVRGGEEPDGE